jgi:hypothetical protein
MCGAYAMSLVIAFLRDCSALPDKVGLHFSLSTSVKRQPKCVCQTVLCNQLLFAATSNSSRLSSRACVSVATGVSDLRDLDTRKGHKRLVSFEHAAARQVAVKMRICVTGGHL